MWVDELSNILWAYKTAHKITMGEISFALNFGDETVIPAEIVMITHRMKYFDEEENNEQMYLNLDLLAEKCECASARLITY